MCSEGSGLSRKLLDKAEQPAALLSRVDAQLHEVLFGHVSAHAQGERDSFGHRTTGLENVRQCCGSGSVDLYLWLTDPDLYLDPAIFVSDFQNSN